MRRGKDRVPDEYAYVARRAAHPWLLRSLWRKRLRFRQAEAFLGRLAVIFGNDAPQVLRSNGADSVAAMDSETPGVIRLPSSVPVGVLCHEYAHLLQYQWWVRMCGAGETPKWKPHGPAFVDQLDRVAIEAAKLLD